MRRRKPVVASEGKDTEEEKPKDPSLSFPWLPWIVFIAVLIGVVQHWIYWAPTPLSVEADPRLFSEERALRFVKVLSDDIGFRQVSTPGLKAAAVYLEQECHVLAELANKRTDLNAQVDVEMVSGSIVDVIFGADLINVYRHLTNIILFIAPKEAAEKEAIMINAHYDSALGSPGAADCASCVGIGLEVLRTMIASGEPLKRPILLLLNGGEETLLQAAHGFIEQSKWRHRVGAFINLESTGSDGAPILFQYAGTWTLSAYARGAPSPRALVLAQEFFESGLLPADTDFRIFSKHEKLRYPGLDIATILDVTSYHTNRDTFSRLRSGSTQVQSQLPFFSLAPMDIGIRHGSHGDTEADDGDDG